jgi:hypothetical protein
MGSSSVGRGGRGGGRKMEGEGATFSAVTEIGLTEID